MFHDISALSCLGIDEKISCEQDKVRRACEAETADSSGGDTYSVLEALNHHAHNDMPELHLSSGRSNEIVPQDPCLPHPSLSAPPSSRKVIILHVRSRCDIRKVGRGVPIGDEWMNLQGGDLQWEFDCMSPVSMGLSQRRSSVIS